MDVKMQLRGNRWITTGSYEDYCRCYDIHPHKVRIDDPKHVKYLEEAHNWCYENIKGTFAAIAGREVVWYYFSDKEDAMLFKLTWV
jgi:hypothetical protein